MGRKSVVALLTVAISTGAGAQSTVWTFGFDDQAIGASGLTLRPGDFDNYLNGGTVTAGNTANPARSGANVYGGTSLSIEVEDAIDYSWPGIGGWLTGTAPITLAGYDYDPDTGLEALVASTILAPGAANRYLSIGSTDAPLFLTRITFASDSYFTLDDLTFGVEGIAPGVPEPATWAMLAIGFGLAGGMLRRRRKPQPLSAMSSK